jgi:hypothetical protein
MIRALLIMVIGVLPMALVVAILGLNADAALAVTAGIERLPSISAAQLSQSAMGSEVLVEGRISDRSPSVFRSFVAYVRERHYLAPDLSDEWRAEASKASPLTVELPDGQARVTNTTYEVINPLAAWIAPGTQTSNPMRYTGIEVGDPVVVVGRVARTGQGASIHADIVIGGTRAEYLAARRGRESSSLVLSGAAGLTVLVLCAAFYLARRRALSAIPARV